MSFHLNNFFKVFEIALYEPIYNHIKNIIVDEQHDFTKNKATTKKSVLYTTILK